MRARLPASLLLLALSGAAWAPALAVGQTTPARGTSGSGGAVGDESASPWNAGGTLFWIAIVVGAMLVLVAGLFLANRGGRTRRAAPAVDDAASSEPAPRAVQHVEAGSGWDVAVVTFDDVHGAERAFAKVGGQGASAPPMSQVAL